MTDERSSGAPSAESPTPDVPNKCMVVKHAIADAARVAHWLICKSGGHTKLTAASELARVVRTLNDNATYQWSDEDLAKLLGDAANV